MARYFRFDHATGKVVETQKTIAKLLPRYPLPCETLAVDPSQIDEARTHDQKLGVPTEYRADGTPIMRDPGHYKNYRRAHGYHFNEAYDD